MADVDKIIDFLETDTVSATFSPKGLVFLSMRRDRGEQNIELGQGGKDKQDSNMRLFIKETVNFIETGRHSMPLDFSSFTDFQRRVFKAVSEIEPGKVVTYKDVAETLGKPGAAQAVGNAVGKNPVAYFLPTHRVIPQRGMAICRSGAGHLKDKLLEHEGHDLSKLRGNYVCTRKKCTME
ncbi:MAG: MGMT family protein [Clostridia bacterium]|nr:MGMT family protein [Clostridia bacterium]